MDDAYAYCRQVGRSWIRDNSEGFDIGSEYAFAYEHANYSPKFFKLESLMVEVVYMTLIAGRRGRAVYEARKQKLIQMISEYDLQKILSILPGEERLAFVNDLKALEILERDA